MKRQLPVEFIFQLFSLFVSIIIVHAIYVSIVRPNATLLLEEQAIQINADPNYVPERSIYIVVRDFEQESCFVLMLWAMSLMGYKAMQAVQERKVLQMDLVPLTEGTSILPEDTREYSRPIQALPASQQRFLLPRALLTALHRFRSTANIQDVSSAIRAICESESERLDSELSMIRYIAWAIPSIGYRPGTRPGPQGGTGRHCRRHAEPRRRIQLDVRRAADQHRRDVPDAPAAARAGTARARCGGLLRQPARPAPADVTPANQRNRNDRKGHGTMTTARTTRITGDDA